MDPQRDCRRRVTRCLCPRQWTRRTGHLSSRWTAVSRLQRRLHRDGSVRRQRRWLLSLRRTVLADLRVLRAPSLRLSPTTQSLSRCTDSSASSRTTSSRPWAVRISAGSSTRPSLPRLSSVVESAISSSAGRADLKRVRTNPQRSSVSICGWGRADRDRLGGGSDVRARKAGSLCGRLRLDGNAGEHRHPRIAAHGFARSHLLLQVECARNWGMAPPLGSGVECDGARRLLGIDGRKSVARQRIAIIRTRWQTRPLSRRAKRRSAAAPVRDERM